MTDRVWPEVYKKLGIAPIINAQSWVTALGGSIMRPEVLQAMDDAASSFVDVKKLNLAAGEVVALSCGAERGLVTAGCSAAQVLMVAACMTGQSEENAEQLPDTTGMKNEVILFKGQRNRYDKAFVTAGATLVEYGSVDSVTAADLEEAINENTACIAYVIAPFLPQGIGLEETIRVAHEHGVPVIVDAAAEVPPRSNLSKFHKMGADMVAFSGGKGIGGPQSAGVLAGKADLMEAVVMNSLNLDSAIAAIGRPMKVSKETIIGLVTALQLFTDSDEGDEWEGWQSKAEYVSERLKGIPGMRVEIEDDPAKRQGPQPVLYFDNDFSGPSTSEIKALLENGDPGIFVGGGGNKKEINIVMVNVQDGEEIIIAERLNEILRS
ncbi:MAG: aminotransferase class V-fold PLP-dependent enzyme [Chloroflexi bacterium]|jgi:L-seryl-tRNA(Ser) seleniumtransferase|nr:aminotransferase class V-fold PLP-dependent enzyme [Chloroflexota bacterium]MBT4142134.1 aminotransferase class V-fold PLP-dependent enzyme [Chloroflexota bacterium]MBT4944487.1 aminotransferase class V-fold PLP-dependent enzyme [Chloroflexota bacterium]MBT5252438.1 aminotransferase class V-fold PLP-dependent enzyme [Chloroflexota bacterium]MBT6707487.1 aminotransferase class V-fold PLP-dependent enzyme [Chloroflexota bacterium]